MKLLFNVIFVNIFFLLVKHNRQNNHLKLSEITLKVIGKENFRILSSDFFRMYKPIEIDINDTLQDIISYEYNFTYPTNYKNIFTIKWNISIIKTNYMFKECRYITEIDLSHFDTSQVDEMIGMFDNCTLLKSLNLSNLNTSGVKFMSNIFSVVCQI